MCSKSKKIKVFFEIWDLKLTEFNKTYPAEKEFLPEFKKLFESVMVTKINGRGYSRPFSITNCSNCISDAIVEVQVFYKKLKI